MSQGCGKRHAKKTESKPPKTLLPTRRGHTTNVTRLVERAGGKRGKKNKGSKRGGAPERVKRLKRCLAKKHQASRENHVSKGKMKGGVNSLLCLKSQESQPAGTRRARVQKKGKLENCSS